MPLIPRDAEPMKKKKLGLTHGSQRVNKYVPKRLSRPSVPFTIPFDIVLRIKSMKLVFFQSREFYEMMVVDEKGGCRTRAQGKKFS